jgi:prolyl oligopeptidase
MKTTRHLALLAALALAFAAHAQSPEPSAPAPQAAPDTPSPSAPPATPAPPAEAAPATPAAPQAIAPATDTLHGNAVRDPYRGLENGGDEATRAFFAQQSTRTREALDRIPGRSALLERLRTLDASTTSIDELQLAGTRLFYLRRAPGDAVPVLVTRESLRAPERVVVDPSRLTPAGWIEWYRASPDGRHVAYGVSRPGHAGQGTVLRVAATDTGRALAFEIDRARFNRHLAWHPDSQSFFYARESEGEGGPGRRGPLRIYRHVLGRETAHDEVVFASGVGGAREVPKYGVPYLDINVQSRYAYALVREGNGREVAVHVTELRDLASGKPRWHRMCGPEDGVVQIAATKDELFVLTHRDAPNFRILQVKATAPNLAGARVVVPARDLVVEDIALAKDALYLRTALAGVDRLERVRMGLLGTKNVEYVRTPFDVAIDDIVADPRRAGVLLHLEGYIDAPAVIEIDAGGDAHDTSVVARSSADFSAMDEVRLYAPIEGGLKIPVTLVYRKGTQLTGRNPTMLVAFGTYGRTFEPEFDPMRLAWLERGGVFAVAHVRGGGEYGQAWHEAARGAGKANSARDLAAVAEFLQHYGFTGPGHLAVLGDGAGAIAVAGAVVLKPELFAAAVARSPITDLLRAEFARGGAADVPEFGSVATREGFDALRAASPYEHVKDRTAYPAVLLTVGLDDPQAVAWHGAKMAARLQAASTSGKPVLLRVDDGAGEGRRLPRVERDAQRADVYAFLFWQLGDPDFQPR